MALMHAAATLSLLHLQRSTTTTTTKPAPAAATHTTSYVVHVTPPSSRRQEELLLAATTSPAGGKQQRERPGRPSAEALAMAGADWARVGVEGEYDDDELGEEGVPPPPPEHLRAFEAFLEEVVPADMLLAFGREEAARARRGEGPRGRQEDVKEKLKLWAKAVAWTTRQQDRIQRNNKNASMYSV